MQTPGSRQQPTGAPTEARKPQETVPLPQLVAQTDELARLLQDIERRLNPDPALGEIDQTLTQHDQEIREGKSELEETLAEDPNPPELNDLEREWRSRLDRYAEWQKNLSERIKALESDLRLLDKELVQWQATVDRIKDDGALKEIVVRVRDKITDIQAIQTKIREQMDQMVVLQHKVSLQEQTVSETVGEITGRKALLQRSLFVPDSAPLWKTHFEGQKIFRTSYQRGLTRLIQFVKARRSTIYWVVIVFLAALLFAIGFKRRLPRVTKEHPLPERTAHFFRRPLSLAILVGLMSTLSLGPALPVLMRNLIAVLFLIPVFRLFVPLMNPVLRPLPYCLAVYGLASRWAEVFGASVQARRWGAVALDAAALLISLWLVRRRHRFREAFGKKAVLIFVAIRIGLLLLFASLVANIFGYTALSRVLREGTLLASYFAVIIYTACLVTIALTSILLHSHLAASIQSVRLHRETILRWNSSTVEILAIFTCLYATFSFFTIRKEVTDRVRRVLSAPITPGTINLSLGDVLAFVVTLFLGIVLARVIRVLLQEDVLPRFSLKRGVPNTVLTLSYLTLVTIVFLLALAAAGTEFSRFTVLTGAFGLGVGFGLQTVITNLASGLLLLLERPVNVGDVVEVEGMIGVVKRIGMRSSTIGTFRGAEVIVPNHNLITNHVINWTLSEQNRRVEIPVGVAFGTDPERVIKLLVDTASSHPGIVRDPPPEAVFIGFGDSSLNFELRFWSPHGKADYLLKSDVAVNIIVAFREAEIRIALPQRELHLKSPDSSINDSRAEDVQIPDVVPRN